MQNERINKVPIQILTQNRGIVPHLPQDEAG